MRVRGCDGGIATRRRERRPSKMARAGAYGVARRAETLARSGSGTWRWVKHRIIAKPGTLASRHIEYDLKPLGPFLASLGVRIEPCMEGDSADPLERPSRADDTHYLLRGSSEFRQLVLHAFHLQCRKGLDYMRARISTPPTCVTRTLRCGHRTMPCVLQIFFRLVGQTPSILLACVA